MDVAAFESTPHHPDGLTLAQINALIEQSYRESSVALVQTSEVLDGSAAERKWHRIERRATEAALAEVSRGSGTAFEVA